MLTVEDDPAIRRGIVDALEFAGYRAIEASDGHSGMEMATRADVDLLILDVVLPGPDGFEILARTREVRPTLPVIMLTARGDESDRVRGLANGADDYVVKPFSVKELMARIEAVLRRSPERPSDVDEIVMEYGTVDLPRREVRLDDGSRVELSEREVDLVRYLAANRGRAIDRDELMANVWRIDPKGLSTRTIDMQIARLREKLGDDSSEPRVVLTVRGKGYMFAAEESDEVKGR
ncbi:MAG: response regulator transcription factor [Pirellulales bacterium]|nr:response regulator transcription factor [Pirellulales bacterium]